MPLTQRQINLSPLVKRATVVQSGGMTNSCHWLHALPDPHPADAPALVDPWGALSFGALRHARDVLAADLIARGIAPGDRVLLVAENCNAYAVAVLALSQVKAWMVLVNARQKPPEIAAIAAHCGARAMLFTAQASTEAQAHAASHQAIDIEAGLSLSLLAPSMAEPVPDSPQTRTAALLYTTGTTSAPKGVQLSHANLMWNAGVSARLRAMTPRDQVIGILPGTHIFGFASAFLAALQAGSCTRFVPRFTPAALMQVFAEGGSVLPAVPQMYVALLAYLNASGAPLVAPCLRYLSAGGAPLEPALKAQVEARFGLTLNNGYGITETSPGVAATRPDTPRSDTSVGPALEDVTITIDAPNAEGIGEILVGGPGVMLGYYRAPQASAAALPRPGLFRTGDLGRLDPDGALHVVGRLKELIIRSGFNVYPPEVEAMITRHPDVRQAAVVGQRHAGNEVILAFVQADNLTPQALKQWLSERLAGYKCPSHILFVDHYPTAATGKILKHHLTRHFATELADLLKDP